MAGRSFTGPMPSMAALSFCSCSPMLWSFCGFGVKSLASVLRALRRPFLPGQRTRELIQTLTTVISHSTPVNPPLSFRFLIQMVPFLQSYLLQVHHGSNIIGQSHRAQTCALCSESMSYPMVPFDGSAGCFSCGLLLFTWLVPIQNNNHLMTRNTRRPNSFIINWFSQFQLHIHQLVSCCMSHKH